MDHISGLAGQKTIVAIDDLHLVDSSPGVATVLNLLVRGLPPAWTLVLSSRRPLPLRSRGWPWEAAGRISKDASCG